MDRTKLAFVILACCLFLIVTGIIRSEDTIPKLEESLGQHVSPQSKLIQLKEYEFDVITINKDGIEVSRRKGKAKYYEEDLGNGVVLEMVRIPGGSFLMGSPESESGRRPDEGPQHRVTLQPFYIGKYEVTAEQWREVCKLPKVKMTIGLRSREGVGDKYPVDEVDWRRAVEFCERLSRKTGRRYRLPTEAEWEYACRAGTTTAYHFGDAITPEVANYGDRIVYTDGIKGPDKAPAGFMGKANGFGLFDMHGNVHEWCLDPAHKNYIGAPNDGSVWERGGDRSDRILRGGGYHTRPEYIRSASRAMFFPQLAATTFGLRVVRELVKGED
jgi:formylglycine-generating enzyme required for sulfatase activity